jgi:hypothetical protein
LVPAPQWTMEPGPSAGPANVEAKAHARLAYLMLASLGVSA